MATKMVKSAKIAKKSAGYEMAWLLGQPSLQSYIDFVEDMTVDGGSVPKSTLVSEWRAANDYYAALRIVGHRNFDHTAGPRPSADAASACEETEIGSAISA